MAKRPAAGRKKSRKPTVNAAASRRPAKRAAAKRPVKRQASARKQAPAKKASKKATPRPVARRQPVSRPKAAAARRPKASAAVAGKVPRLDRSRRTLDDGETMRTPPSSLDLNRRGSAARTGRAEMAQSDRNHKGMSPDIQGGDVDVDVEDAYFTGEEAPGGDNPTPDQDVVDDIGKALGVTYEDNEELKGSDKVVERDKHRWELDPASAEDYTEHDKD
ncbi:MAG: hypothetical protein JWL71_1078 [Acidobacteria bacterium]|jgi:hypothetical protein|nr:hypothetical protein [Acidobacteriota bacterium]